MVGVVRGRICFFHLFPKVKTARRTLPPHWLPHQQSSSCLTNRMLRSNFRIALPCKQRFPPTKNSVKIRYVRCYRLLLYSERYSFKFSPQVAPDGFRKFAYATGIGTTAYAEIPRFASEGQTVPSNLFQRTYFAVESQRLPTPWDLLGLGSRVSYLSCIVGYAAALGMALGRLVSGDSPSSEGSMQNGCRLRSFRNNAGFQSGQESWIQGVGPNLG